MRDTNSTKQNARHKQYKTKYETQTVAYTMPTNQTNIQNITRHTYIAQGPCQLTQFLHYVTQPVSKITRHGTLCKLQIIYSHITRMLQRNILKPSCTTVHKEGRPTLDLQHNKQITQLDVDGKRLEHTKDKRQLYR